MARITDANLAFVGQEPKFSVELSSIDMIKTLSWYSQNKDTKDAVKWATEYFKKKQKEPCIYSFLNSLYYIHTYFERRSEIFLRFQRLLKKQLYYLPFRTALKISV